MVMGVAARAPKVADEVAIAAKVSTEVPATQRRMDLFICPTPRNTMAPSLLVQFSALKPRWQIRGQQPGAR
jgi:hypothetical protein